MSFSTALIGDLTKIRTGKIDANAATQDGIYPFFTCAREPLSIDKYAYDCDAILVAGNGDLNVKHYKGKFEAYQRTYIIEVAEETKIDSRYLYFFMSKYVEKLRELSIGGVIKYIKLGMLTDAEIPLPSLNEQKRIAAILDKADVIRRKRQQVTILADEFLHATFLDMFGDPVTNPKRWEEVHLQDIADIASGVTKGRKFNGKRTIHIPYMRVANIQDGHIDLREIKEIEALEMEVQKYALVDGDILLTEGGDPDKLGRGAVWREEIKPCIHQNHIFRVRVDNSKIAPEYLCALIGSARGKRYFLRAAKQTTGIASINMTQLKGFTALLPPISLQDKYVNLLKRYEKFVKSKSNFAFMNEELFNSLTQRAFRGEL